jgi:GAF domain-containing protein
MNDATSLDLLQRLTDLNQIGIALSRQKDITRLLEVILAAAKEITNADGGTLYRMHQDKELKFEIMLTDSLGIAMGGSTGKPIPYLPVKLYEDDGTANNSMVVAYAVLPRSDR